MHLLGQCPHHRWRQHRFYIVGIITSQVDGTYMCTIIALLDSLPLPNIHLLTTRIVLEINSYPITDMVQLSLIEVNIGLALDEAM